MDRAVFRRIATPEDRHEYRKWARRVSMFYGVLFLAGISFAAVHHYQTPAGAGVNTAAGDVARTYVALATPITLARSRQQTASEETIPHCHNGQSFLQPSPLCVTIR
jgi:hypothetical protein